MHTVLLLALVAQLPPKLNALVDRPLRVLRQDRTPGGFKIIALSHAAEYCVSRYHAQDLPQKEAARCTSSLLKAGLHHSISPYKKRSLAHTPLGGHGLYLSHLAIIMSANARTGAHAHPKIHRRIVDHLAQRTLRASDHHVSSYASSKRRWPADQTATLYALHLYDYQHRTSIGRKPILAWLRFMEKKNAPRWGLPVNEVTGRAPKAGVPRGSALSFSVRYMAAFAPREAREIWKRYKRHFLDQIQRYAGFREWPREVDGPQDIDSGPIVMGLGAAATGLALGASRAVSDMPVHERLVATSRMARTLQDQLLDRVGDSALARSIELCGKHYSRWWMGFTSLEGRF